MTTPVRARAAGTRLGRAALPLALLLAGVALPAAPAASVGRDLGNDPGCSEPVIAEPVRIRDLVKARGAESSVVQSLEERGSALAGTDLDLVELSEDPTAWVGPCGVVHFVEPSRAAIEPEQAAAPVTSLASTFELSSRPSASRVIYLDFNGETVSGSYWNKTYGDPIDAAPFSLDSVQTTAFSDAELTHIQQVWSAVAEDFAPFDVNVTTKDPGSAGIVRSTSADPHYGSRVVITQEGPIESGCACAGMATLGTFDRVSSTEYTQPAWVFTSESTTYDALTVSHEAGHNLGLEHDGTSARDYYGGDGPWMPIMGGGTIRRVAQWSKGEYPGADNAAQDDVAIIATKTPYAADDHAAPGGVPTPLLTGVPVDGRITTRTDRDAFSFTTQGATTVSVTSPTALPNLDVRLTIVDAAGAPVADVDPAVSWDGTSGLMASWSGTLAPGAYTAVVDGVGSGDPAISGHYSDYASLGRYAISLSTQTVTPDVVVDQDAPVVSGLDFSPESVDLAEGVQSVTVTVRVTDATGTLAPAVGLSSDSTSQSLGPYAMSLVSGTALDGTWSGTVSVPTTAALGSWTVALQPLTDQIGNSDGLTHTHPDKLTVTDSTPTPTPTEPTPTSTPTPTPTPTDPTPTPTPSTSSVPSTPVASVPGRMRAPRVVVRGRRVVVRWHAASSSTAVTRYVIDRSKGRDRVVGPSLKTVFKRMRPGRYRVRIAALNAAGVSPFSAWVTFRVRR